MRPPHRHRRELTCRVRARSLRFSLCRRGIRCRCPELAQRMEEICGHRERARSALSLAVSGSPLIGAISLRRRRTRRARHARDMLGRQPQLASLLEEELRNRPRRASRAPNATRPRRFSRHRAPRSHPHRPRWRVDARSGKPDSRRGAESSPDVASSRPAHFTSRGSKNCSPFTHPLRGPELWALRAWKREQGDATPYVFTSPRGAPMTRRTVHHVVAEAAKAARIDFADHPHMLRHATGFYLANAGQDTRAI